MVVITGTFALGWSAALVDALTYLGYRVVGSSAYNDPFALLLHRIKNCHVDVVVVTHQDVAPKHPHVDTLLHELACTLMPQTHTDCVVINADPNEYFAKCIDQGTADSMAEIAHHRRYLGPNYLDMTVCREIDAPAYVADTPELLRNFLGANKLKEKNCHRQVE
jgi:hypothetical protein